MCAFLLSLALLLCVGGASAQTSWRFDHPLIDWETVVMVDGVNRFSHGLAHRVLFGCSKSPCIITKSLGGEYRYYAFAAKGYALLPDYFFVVNGYCNSACILFIDIARERVCLGPKAMLGFHKFTEDGRPIHPPYSADIHRRALRFGWDYPDPKDGMDFHRGEDFVEIWPACELKPPLPRPDPRKSVATASAEAK